MVTALPPCGIYRTGREVAGIAAGRLVYFHNHGTPGPGLYLPSSWQNNRAQWHATGSTLNDEAEAIHLEVLLAEGLYRVTEPFFCCQRRCLQFETDRLVQLGYDGGGTPILFTPELRPQGLHLPTEGTVVDAAHLVHLKALKVAEAQSAAPLPAGGMVH